MTAQVHANDAESRVTLVQKHLPETSNHTFKLIARTLESNVTLLIAGATGSTVNTIFDRVPRFVTLVTGVR